MYVPIVKPRSRQRWDIHVRCSYCNRLSPAVLSSWLECGSASITAIRLHALASGVALFIHWSVYSSRVGMQWLLNISGSTLAVLYEGLRKAKAEQNPRRAHLSAVCERQRGCLENFFPTETADPGEPALEPPRHQHHIVSANRNSPGLQPPVSASLA